MQNSSKNANKATNTNKFGLLWTKKNKRLVILLGFLLLTILLVDNIQKPGSEQEINYKIFTQDTARIHSITLKTANQSISLNKSRSQSWFNEKKQLVDFQKVYFTLSILAQNRVKRVLNQEDGHQFYQQYKRNEVQVILNDNEETFFVFCNDKKTKSYWTKGHEQYYNVGLEGYNTPICDAFNVDSLFWKSPYIFSAHLRYMKSISYKHNEQGKNYQIKLENGEFSVDFQNKSANAKESNKEKMVQWVKTLAGLGYVDFVNKTLVHSYDSLLKTTPLSSLEMEAILSQKENNLSIYPKLKGDTFHIVDFGNSAIVGRINKDTFEFINFFKDWMNNKRK